jgi:hypothetical protein
MTSSATSVMLELRCGAKFLELSGDASAIKIAISRLSSLQGLMVRA